MPDAAFAQKIGRSIPNQAVFDRRLALHQFIRTDGCIFGGNSPFCGTQEPEFRLVARFRAHGKGVVC
jgi:hypothetical protein